MRIVSGQLERRPKRKAKTMSEDAVEAWIDQQIEIEDMAAIEAQIAQRIEMDMDAVDARFMQRRGEAKIDTASQLALPVMRVYVGSLEANVRLAVLHLAENPRLYQRGRGLVYIRNGEPRRVSAIMLQAIISAQILCERWDERAGDFVPCAIPAIVGRAIRELDDFSPIRVYPETSSDHIALMLDEHKGLPALCARQGVERMDAGSIIAALYDGLGKDDESYDALRAAVEGLCNIQRPSMQNLGHALRYHRTQGIRGRQLARWTWA